MKEILKKIDGYEYYVTNLGKIKNKNLDDKTLSKNKNGYLSVSLWRNGKEKRFLVHRIVAKYFIGDINGLEVNHKDFNKTNNEVSNLEIITHEQNVTHAKNAKRYPGNKKAHGSNNGGSKIKEEDVIKIREMKKSGLTYKEIMSIFPIKKSALHYIISGKSWKNVPI